MLLEDVFLQSVLFIYFWRKHICILYFILLFYFYYDFYYTDLFSVSGPILRQYDKYSLLVFAMKKGNKQCLFDTPALRSK